MLERREFICITCPVGCTIDAVVDGDELVEIEGYDCKRGISFVREELTAPKRMLTTTVRVEGGVLSLVPVRSRRPVPKDLVLEIAAALRKVVVQAPVAEHQVVLENVLDSGVDIIASRDLGEDETRATEY